MQNDFSIIFSKKYPFKLWGILIAIFIFLTYAFYQINAIIAPFLIGFLGAYLLKSPMKMLEKIGIYRSISAFIVVLFMYFIFILFIMWAIPFVQQELILLIKSYPQLQEKFFCFLYPYIKSLSKLTGTISVAEIKSQFFGSFGSIVNFMLNIILSLFSNGLALANLLSFFILTPFVMYYSLKDWDKLINHLKSLIPTEYKERVIAQFEDIDLALTAYIKGQVIVCSILMVSYSFLLTFIDLRYAIFVGCLTGFLAFVPYLGVAVGFLVALTIGFSHFEVMGDVFKIIAVFGCLSPIEGYFLTPRFVGKSIGLHPVLIIFSLFALGSWFGLIGIILALPLSAIISTIIRNFIRWYRSRFVERYDHPKLRNEAESI
jgi:putative permease